MIRMDKSTGQKKVKAEIPKPLRMYVAWLPAQWFMFKKILGFDYIFLIVWRHRPPVVRTKYT